MLTDRNGSHPTETWKLIGIKFCREIKIGHINCEEEYAESKRHCSTKDD